MRVRFFSARRPLIVLLYRDRSAMDVDSPFCDR